RPDVLLRTERRESPEPLAVAQRPRRGVGPGVVLGAGPGCDPVVGSGRASARDPALVARASGHPPAARRRGRNAGRRRPPGRPGWVGEVYDLARLPDRRPPLRRRRLRRGRPASTAVGAQPLLLRKAGGPPARTLP